MDDYGVRIHYGALEQCKLEPNKKYLYIFQTEDEKNYFANTRVPSKESVVEDYYDWALETTDCISFDLIGFMIPVSNTTIIRSYNVTKIAEQHGIDLSTVDIIEFIRSFKHTKFNSYYTQIDYYIKYLKSKQGES